jgi:preprotein translocase subunit SecD
LEQATARNLGHQLAIVINGLVESAPTIKEPIHGGHLSITLRSPEAARALASALK